MQVAVKCLLKLIKVDQQMYQSLPKYYGKMDSQLLEVVEKLIKCTLLCKVVELIQLWQLHIFARLPKLLKVRLDVC